MDPFTLTTYNVHCFPWTSPAIRDIVAWIVLHSGTDIVTLQEIWCRHDEWSAAFAAHGWTFARPARESHIATLFGSGLATAWSSTKWRLTDSRFYPFLESIGLDQLTAKGWFRTDLQQSTGAHMRLINTHMQADYDIYGGELRHVTEAIRRRQVIQLLAVENTTHLPTLVVGDMNTDNCWFPTGWLLDLGQTKPVTTFPSTIESLDHCTALGPFANRWAVEGFHVSHLDLSDHYPVSWLLSTSSRASARGPSQTCHQVPHLLTVSAQAASLSLDPHHRRSPPPPHVRLPHQSLPRPIAQQTASQPPLGQVRPSPH